MIIAQKLPDDNYLVGTETMSYNAVVMTYFFRIHLANGDIAIYESRDEMPTVAPSFDIDEYSERINEAHNLLFRTLYTQRDYLSTGEIAMWFGDSEFGAEATALCAWWNSTCKIVAEYLASLTEETALPVNEFIDSLPVFVFKN